MQYVVSSNGCTKVADKAMSPEDILATNTQVDRGYYLERIQRAMNKIFEPIFAQQAGRSSRCTPALCVSPMHCTRRD